MNELDHANRTATATLLFEGGVGVAAVLIGVWVGVAPAASMLIAPESGDKPLWLHNLSAIGWGIAATVPLVAGLLLIERIRWRPLERMNRFMDRIVVPLFRPMSLGQLAIIAAAAGIGEELMFRGVIQTGLNLWWGPTWGTWTALLVASLAFGLAHPITLAYTVAAAVVGVYLGGLYLWTGNILAPIVTHGLYDFLALVYLCRLRLSESP